MVHIVLKQKLEIDQKFGGYFEKFRNYAFLIKRHLMCVKKLKTYKRMFLHVPLSDTSDMSYYHVHFWVGTEVNSGQISNFSFISHSELIKSKLK